MKDWHQYNSGTRNEPNLLHYINIIMTVILKPSSDKVILAKLLENLPKPNRFDAHKLCGALKLKQSPLTLQLKMRDEWE